MIFRRTKLITSGVEKVMVKNCCGWLIIFLEFFCYFSIKFKTWLVSLENINIKWFSYLERHMSCKVISWNARQAKWLLHLSTYLLDKACSPQGYFLKCKISWVMHMYTRYWFSVLTRCGKVGAFRATKVEAF